MSEEEAQEIEEEEQQTSTTPDKHEEDPIIMEYANDLKTKLGDNYDNDLDSYPVRQRIEIMKHMVKVMPKKKAKSPFPKPRPELKDKPKKSALKIPGTDWRKFKR